MSLVKEWRLILYALLIVIAAAFSLEFSGLCGKELLKKTERKLSQYSVG